MVALRLYRPGGTGPLTGFLSWRDGETSTASDLGAGEFAVEETGQQITIGYRADAWVAVWIGDTLVRQVDAIHYEKRGAFFDIGRLDSNTTAPGGTLLFDDLRFQVPRVDQLWVDAAAGDDGNDGLSPATAFATLLPASELAGPGTVVHVLPGDYRETLVPAMSGYPEQPVVYRSEQGGRSAVIRGSEPSSALIWSQLLSNEIGLPVGVDPSSIYYTDLPWEPQESPRFVAVLDADGQVEQRLPLAREPDWQVETEWKHHEQWWAANGGWEPASCVPSPATPQCDEPSRSRTQLTDTEPDGPHPGDLTTLTDLVGGTVRALDNNQGHDIYVRKIVAHEPGLGRITVDRECGSRGRAFLGWGSKYFVEDRPSLLDSPGEWWYDGSHRLYLWPPQPGDPSTMRIEISRRENGVLLNRRPYVTLQGLAVELVDEDAVHQGNWSHASSHGNRLLGVTLRHAGYGVRVNQDSNEPEYLQATGFTVEDSEIGFMDVFGISLGPWWPGAPEPAQFVVAPLTDTLIRGTELHHLGFRTPGTPGVDTANGNAFICNDHLRFEGNHLHHTAHNGIQVSYSLVDSDQQGPFAPEEILIGDLLFKDNIFEMACQLTTDCGALKFWGKGPDNHVFRDVLVVGNIFRDTFGWTQINEHRGNRWAGPDSPASGLGGFGLYVDVASGVHAYRNIAYNVGNAGFHLYANTTADWRDGPTIYVNNVAANSVHGIFLGGYQTDPVAFDSRFLNNIVLNNEARGVMIHDNDNLFENILFDHNLYCHNGWRTEGGVTTPTTMTVGISGAADHFFTSLQQIQAGTDWEASGISCDTAAELGLVEYDINDVDYFDGSRPDFRLTAGSLLAIDQGAELPPSLVELLVRFEIDTDRIGVAWDIGVDEYDPGAVTPDAGAKDAGPLRDRTMEDATPGDRLFADQPAADHRSVDGGTYDSSLDEDGSSDGGAGDGAGRDHTSVVVDAAAGQDIVVTDLLRDRIARDRVPAVDVSTGGDRGDLDVGDGCGCTAKRSVVNDLVLVLVGVLGLFAGRRRIRW